jgi:hypothetical protein
MSQPPQFRQFLQQQRDDIPQMDPKACIARSFAASYLWNRRNLEGPWYGRSDQVWHNLTSPFPNMIVVPQYPLWLSEQELDEEADEEDEASDEASDGSEETDVDEAVTRNDLADQQPVLCVESDDHDCVEADITEDSLITIPEHNAAELFPDFVILHFRTKPLRPNHPRFVQLAGIRITHECCPIIIENKRMPRRRTDAALFDGSFHDELERHLLEAISDLERQCAYAFKKYRHALSIIAVAVAGDYWCHLSVPFNIVCPVDDEYTVVSSDWNSLKWPLAVAFGTLESDRRLGELRSVLERKAGN